MRHAQRMTPSPFILGIILFVSACGGVSNAQINGGAHLEPATEATLSNSWICSGRNISVEVEASEKRPIRVLKYIVDGISAPSSQLGEWNQHLVSISEMTRVSVLCDAKHEAVMIEGISISKNGKREKITITASGGGGHIGGYSTSAFWTYTGN